MNIDIIIDITINGNVYHSNPSDAELALEEKLNDHRGLFSKASDKFATRYGEDCDLHRDGDPLTEGESIYGNEQDECDARYQEILNLQQEIKDHRRHRWSCKKRGDTASQKKTVHVIRELQKDLASARSQYYALRRQRATR